MKKKLLVLAALAVLAFATFPAQSKADTCDSWRFVYCAQQCTRAYERCSPVGYDGPGGDGDGSGICYLKWQLCLDFCEVSCLPFATAPTEEPKP